MSTKVSMRFGSKSKLVEIDLLFKFVKGAEVLQGIGKTRRRKQ